MAYWIQSGTYRKFRPGPYAAKAVCWHRFFFIWTGQEKARYLPTVHRVHHKDLPASWDELTIISKKHTGHPLNLYVFLGGSKPAQTLEKVLFYKKRPLPKASRVWYISGILYRFSKHLEVMMETVRLSRQHQKILKMLHDGNSLKKNKQPPWHKNRYALSASGRNS